MQETEINEKIKNYCMLAISYGRRLKKPLDGSLQGALNLEKIFEIFHRDLYGSPMKQLIRRMTRKELTEEHVEAMARILGAYLGELIRSKLGEDCKWVESEDEKAKGKFHLVYGELRIFPVDKAYQRLIEGRRENVFGYYKSFNKEPEK